MDKEATDDKTLLEEAKANYAIASEWWKENRKQWLDAAKFRALDQWPETVKSQREQDGLPCLVVDKLNQYVKQVVNDGRQNRPAVKVRPVDDGADQDGADGFQGMVRSICNKSSADTAFDTSLDHAAGNGYGFIRVATEYAHENTFHQELCVKRVRNPLAVMLAPHEEADGSDADFGFVEMLVPKKKYKKQYPKAKETNWESDNFGEGWSDSDNVKVCEYFYKVEEPRTLHLLDTGDVVEDADYQKAIAEHGVAPAAIVESREIPVVKVKWCRMSGAEILEQKDWKGKWIPLIPVYGDESDIEGKVSYTGLIRLGRDPQILHNFSRSAFAQRVALTPSAPWMVAEGQIEGYEKEWRAANKPGTAVLTYKLVDVDGKPCPPPQRVQPSDIPAGFAQDMQMSEHDIQGALGMYNASLGEKSNEKSGKAIMARQREGDTATFHYPDNLNRSIRHLGRILVDAIPHYYDGTRVVRMLGEDGTTTEAQVDPNQPVAYQKVGDQAIYNFGVGIYDVDISAGPSYTTKRQESAEAMIELTRANPVMWQTHGDLIVGAQDWPNAEAFAKRSKLTLPPEIRQALEAEDGGQDPAIAAAQAQVQQIEAEAQQAIAEREQALEQMQRELQELKSQAAIKRQEVAVKGYEARTERMLGLAPAVPAEMVQQIVVQTVQAMLTQPQPQESSGPMPTMEPGDEMMEAGMPPEMPPEEMMQPNPPADAGFFTPDEGMPQ
jgi:hypothetical protein